MYDLTSRLSEESNNHQSLETFDEPNILYGMFPETENNLIEKAAFNFRNKKKGIGKYMQGSDY